MRGTTNSQESGRPLWINIAVVTAMLLACALLLVGCSTARVVSAPCPDKPKIPKELMQPSENEWLLDRRQPASPPPSSSPSAPKTPASGG